MRRLLPLWLFVCAVLLPAWSAARAAPLAEPRTQAPSLLTGEVRTERFRIRHTERARVAAGALAAEIEETRSRFQAALGRDWPGVTEVRIGVGRGELEAIALPGHRPPGWAVALAYPEDNLILLEALALTEPQNAATVKHELSHVALGQLGKGWPRWFQEGVAQRLTGDGGGMALYSALFHATRSGTLFALEDLTRHWPERPTDVQLAYAQSASFVEHLLDLHGREAFSLLFDHVAEGDPFPTAFAKAFRTSLRLAEESWRAQLPSRYSYWPIITAGTSLWAVAAGLSLLAFWRRSRRKAQALEAMQREDDAEDALEAELALALPPPSDEPAPTPEEAKPTLH